MAALRWNDMHWGFWPFQLSPWGTAHSVLLIDMFAVTAALIYFERRLTVLLGLYLMATLLASVAAGSPVIVEQWVSDGAPGITADLIFPAFGLALPGIFVVPMLSALLDGMLPIRTRTTDCICCGYSLVGVTIARCPECGEVIDFEAMGISLKDLQRKDQ